MTFTIVAIVSLVLSVLSKLQGSQRLTKPCDVIGRKQNIFQAVEVQATARVTIPGNSMFATQAVQFGGCGLVMHSKRKKDGKISRTMNDADHLNRIRLPAVDHHIRVEVPKAIVPIEQFVVVVPHARRAA